MLKNVFLFILFVVRKIGEFTILIDEYFHPERVEKFTQHHTASQMNNFHTVVGLLTIGVIIFIIIFFRWIFHFVYTWLKSKEASFEKTRTDYEIAKEDLKFKKLNNKLVELDLKSTYHTVARSNGQKSNNKRNHSH